MAIFNWGQSVILTYKHAHNYVVESSGCEFDDYAGPQEEGDDVPVIILTYDPNFTSIEERIFWLTRDDYEDVDWDDVVANTTTNHTYHSDEESHVVENLLSEYFYDVVMDREGVELILKDRGFSSWWKGDTLYTKDNDTGEVEYCDFDGETPFDEIEWHRDPDLHRQWSEETEENLY